jgi:hypothetical protein
LRFPRGKGFDLACGIVITVFLDDFIPLTGTFLGNVHDPHHRRSDLHEFILIQLTCPFRSKRGAKIPAGTFCAINIEQILFIIPGKKSPHDTCQAEIIDDDCHDMIDDKGDDFDIWEDECGEKHVVNIKCNRTEGDKQHVININCNNDNTTADDENNNLS